MQICLDGQATMASSVLALGMFDGVHLGHRVLLRRAKALARQQGVPLVAGTFTTHPMALVHPEKCPPMLTTLEERAHKMEALGVDLLSAQPFDKAVMDTPPENFIAGLCRQFHPRFVVVGYNHTFGRKGEGTPLLLSALGEVFGYRAEVVPKITLGGRDVSSSIIRGLLAQGDVDLARQMLAAPYLRQAAVAKDREGFALVMQKNGKLDLPAGRYRVLLGVGGQSLPAEIEVVKEGQAQVGPLPGLEADSQVDLRFYHRQT